MFNQNLILTSANAALEVTNCTVNSSLQTFPGVPLGTGDGSATGPIAVKVMLVGTGGSSGGTVTAVPKQYNTSSTPVIGTTNATVLTLAAGEKGIIQNLDDAALAVRYGASCSTTVFTVILKAGSAADDGLGGVIVIDDWIGVVSVCAMAGTARYMANKLS